MHILFLMPLDEVQRERILAVLPDDVTVSWDRQAAIGKAKPVTAIVGGPPPELVEHLHQLEWVQFRTDSLEKWSDTLRQLAPRDVVVTRTSGSYNETVPDHALMLVLALARDLPGLAGRLRAHTFSGEPLRTTPLARARMVIVGFGSLGRAIAERAAALGMKIVGVDPVRGELPAGVEEIVRPESLLDVVPSADFVVAAMPHTPSTEGAIGAEVLAAMKPTAHLVNVGRGINVDTAALLRALDEGRLAGAGLDVTEPTPLPADHPLWEHPRVILTCHTAPHGSRPEKVQFDQILDNLKRYAEGRELLMRIDPSLWS